MGYVTPSRTTWIATAATVAREEGIPVGAIVGGGQTKPVWRARWKAWKAVLDKNADYSVAGLARISGWHHTTILSGLRRLNEPVKAKAKRKSYNEGRAMKRREFSNYLQRVNSELGMTAEEFAEATGLSLRTILARAKAAGITMRRAADLLPTPKFLIGMGVRKATQDDPRVDCVMLELRSL